jgi:hypothetical protein
MSKWTKKDIKALCGHLDTFWLRRRPHDGEGWEAAKQNTRTVLSAPHLRKEVVLAGVREFEQMHACRYSRNCETVGNEIARFGKGLDDELVQRFVKLAKEEDASQKTATRLRERILAEGLPEEVVAYDPTTR